MANDSYPKPSAPAPDDEIDKKKRAIPTVFADLVPNYYRIRRIHRDALLQKLGSPRLAAEWAIYEMVVDKQLRPVRNAPVPFGIIGTDRITNLGSFDSGWEIEETPQLQMWWRICNLLVTRFIERARRVSRGLTDLAEAIEHNSSANAPTPRGRQMPAPKPDLRSLFEFLWQSLFLLSDDVMNPPPEAAGVAEWLKAVGKSLSPIRQFIKKNGVEEAIFNDVLNSASLHGLARDGVTAVNSVAIEPENPFVDRQKPSPTDATTESMIDAGPTGAAKTSEEFVFAPDGDGYFIAGFGERGYVGRMLGFKYIFRLLQSSTGIGMLELIEENNDPRITGDRRSVQPTLDKKALHTSYDELTKMQVELEAAKADNDYATASQLEVEIEDLRAAINKALSVTGKSRDLNNPEDRLRPRIWNRLNGAIKKLRERDPPMAKLAAHFSVSIDRSPDGCFTYRNPASLRWVFTMQSKS